MTEEYFNKPDRDTIQKNPNPGNDAMFDLQIKSIINNLDFSVSGGNMNDSIVTLRIVEAAKRSMLEGKAVKLNKE